MIKLVGEPALTVAIARAGMTPGRAIVDGLIQLAHAHPNRDIRVTAAEMVAIETELGILTEAAGRLGEEVRAYRDNVRVRAVAPVEGRQRCVNCRFFEAVKSIEAHVVVEHQNIAEDVGACCVDPPTTTLVPGRTPTASHFRLVHPARWCGRWEKLDSRMVMSE